MEKVEITPYNLDEFLERKGVLLEYIKHSPLQFLNRFQAVITYDEDRDIFRGEFVCLNGGADFYGADIKELRREGEKSLNTFLEVCKDRNIEPLQPLGGDVSAVSPIWYMMAIIPAREGGYFVLSPDFRQVTTQGDTFLEAVEMAMDALSLVVEYYIENKIPLPDPCEEDEAEKRIRKDLDEIEATDIPIDFVRFYWVRI